MRNHSVPGEEPRCTCGALLDGSDPAQCRKCRARARWQRRRANPRRRNRHLRPGPFNPPEA